MRYFIAFRLAGLQEKEVQALREEISSVFDVHQALRIPPHLTLFYPFDYAEHDLPQLKAVLADFALKQSSFELEIKNFSFFDNKVWFIDVDQSSRLHNLKNLLVDELDERLSLVENRKGHNDVHFHITLAYKDVSPEKFVAIGEFLKTKKVPISKIDINRITLFKNVDQMWVEENSWALKQI